MPSESNKSELVSKLLASYAGAAGGGGKVDNDLAELIDEAKSRLGAGLLEEGVCLVCLEAMGDTEAIWSCSTCYESIHIVCIQSWASQALAEAALSEEPPENPVWACPKCRSEYPERQKPSKYYCYCRKEINPKPDPWLAPHSCGAICGRSLGACGHKCHLLCHPGPCPPCPQLVKISCHCGKKPAKARRCGLGGWGCGEPCDRLLDCGKHRCKENCHAGECQPCDKSSKRPCKCGKLSQDRPCRDGAWSCEEICNKPLKPCGKHRCLQKCHSGDCGNCVEAGERRCPCGKTEYASAGGCRDEKPCCGDTCGKLLPCGIHQCQERCHRGPCPPCRQTSLRRCSCGAKEKEAPCAKDWSCDLKCRRQRSCGKHLCNRRCCDGSCPPCSQPCGQRLPCGQHKCQSACHKGKCYPCIRIEEISCPCGATKIRRPCGAVKRRDAKPPKCLANCAKPPDCHHAKREPHPCHSGPCPPCKQICGKKHSGCSHACPAVCHSAVWENENANSKAKTAWELKRPAFKLVEKPCPPCVVPVPLKCLGEHEEGSFPCSELKPYSCARPCGKVLACGNHSCSKLCHGPKEVCEDCHSMCSLERPKGCEHKCPKACHPPPCAPCRQSVKVLCHCGLNPVFTPCPEWQGLSEKERSEKRRCGNKCPKTLACGHVCTFLCHPQEEPCSSISDCSKKVTILCPCKRRSSKVKCSEAKTTSLDCDESCEAAKAAKALESEQELSRSTSYQSQSSNDVDPSAPGPRRRRKKKERDESEDLDKPNWAKFAVPCAVIVALAGFGVWILMS